jgi:hypothetical protein
MGPLGFAKILINSGAFDACATQRLYERFIGRPIDPIQESGYLSVLTQQFVSGGRQLRPFVRYLLGSPDFRRGL